LNMWAISHMGNGQGVGSIAEAPGVEVTGPGLIGIEDFPKILRVIAIERTEGNNLVDLVGVVFKIHRRLGVEQVRNSLFVLKSIFLLFGAS